jgi:hypothetical protein
LTARAATWSRSASRALLASCSASTLAAATIFAPSALARPLASSTIDCARRSAVGQALGGVVAGGRQLRLDALVGLRQFGLGLVGGRQAVGDLLRPCVERGRDRRPDVLHREPDQDQEHDHLNDECGGDAHSAFGERSKAAASGGQGRADYFGRLASWLRNGLAVVNHSAIPVADDERRVDQAGQQEHLGLQFAHQLGLARGRLEVLAAHDADADAGAEGTQTDDQTGGRGQQS